MPQDVENLVVILIVIGLGVLLGKIAVPV